MGLSVLLQSHISSVLCEGEEASLAHCNFTRVTAEGGSSQPLQGLTAAGVDCAGQLKYKLHVYLAI